MSLEYLEGYSNQGAQQMCGYYEMKRGKLLLSRCRFSQIVNTSRRKMWYYIITERNTPIQTERKKTMIDMNIICELIEKASNSGTAVLHQLL